MKSLTDSYVLSNGVQIPCIGFGTWQTPEGEVAVSSVKAAIDAGYRHIDTAAIYGNEEGVGRGIRESGVKREELFITTKLWISDMGYEKAKAALETSLHKLGMDYVDLYLIHHPFGDYYGAWRAVCEAYRGGRALAVGVSNFYADRLTDLALHNDVFPAVDQLEIHPYHQRHEMEDSLREYGTVPQAWGPFSQGKTDLLDNPMLVSIGEKYGKTTAQVCLRWLIQRGISALPKSTRRERIRENFDVFDFQLSAADMAAITLLDRGKPAGLPHTDPANVKRIFYL